MVATRHCLYPKCHNDSRHNYKIHMRGVFFIPFPKPKTNLVKCLKWLKSCGQSSPDDVKKHWFICSKHFVGGNGPSENNPDPLSYNIKVEEKDNSNIVKCGIQLGWSYGESDKSVIFTKSLKGIVVFQLIWENRMNLEIRALNSQQCLNESHFIWKLLPKQAVTNNEIMVILEKLNGFGFCCGSPELNIRNIFHSLPSTQQKTGYECNNSTEPCIRSVTCSKIIELNCRRKRCNGCIRYRQYLQYTKNNLRKKQLHASVTKMKSKQRRQKQGEFFKMRVVDKDSLKEIFKEQKRRNSQAKNKYGFKWHPDVIEWCQILKQQSPGNYELMRQSGVMALPCMDTLSKKVKTSSDIGLSTETLLALKREFSQLGIEEHKQFISLAWDEVKTKGRVKYEATSNRFIGSLSKDTSNGFQVMVRGITTDFKFPLHFIPSISLSPSEVFDIVWEAVEKLECIGFKVLAFVCNESYRTFSHMCSINDSMHKHKILNKYARGEERYIHFISDVPHLIKATRNCMSNSDYHLHSRRLWKNGKSISWTHIVNLYKDPCGSPLRLARKLTFSHVFLNLYSKMRVKLASQVLSNLVADALASQKNENLSETIRFLQTFNKLYDILNSKPPNELKEIGNPHMLAIYSVNDERLKWLEEDFLGYLKDWEKDVANREGNFTTGERNKMLLSVETREGLERSVVSIVAVVKYLLQKGAPFVFTNHLNQDFIEEFGVQATTCSSIDNSTFLENLHNSKRMRLIRPIMKKYKKFKRC